MEVRKVGSFLLEPTANAGEISSTLILNQVASKPTKGTAHTVSP
jgi:hypothetical protein